MKKAFVKIFAAALLASAAVAAQADVIVQNTGGAIATATPFYYGESFKTPADFLYYNLTFNFYSNVPATSSSAAGTAFLLSQPYTGTPAALGVTTPGFLTQSVSATGGVYTFNPNFVLLTNTFYFLYSNAVLVDSGGNSFPNALVYSSPNANTPFISSLDSAGNFSLKGTRVGLPLPEPSSQTALYFLSGIVGLGFVVLRRRRRLA